MLKSAVYTTIVLTILLLFASCYSADNKELKLNPLFSDNMVLQQQDDVAIWGSYTPNKKVQISGSWGAEQTTFSDESGNWTARLETPNAGGPFELSINTVDTTINLANVLIGEVWLASGQSNMEMPLPGFLPNEPIDNYEAEIANANYPNIRFINVARALSPAAEDNFNGEWMITSPETAENFSATAYFFARELNQQLNIPIGIIHSSWGGTPVESWMSKEKLLSLNEFEDQLESINEESIAEIKAWFGNFPSIDLPSTIAGWEEVDLQDTKYSTTNFDDSEWDKVDLPVLVEELENSGVNGAYWFRKNIGDLDPNLNYVLRIAQGIDDMDIVYVNGQKIGSMVCWDCPRKYEIPKSIIKQGENHFAIRVIDTGGPGGFRSDVQLIDNSGKKIPIHNAWRYQHIADIQNSQFVLYHENLEAFRNSSVDISSFNFSSRSPSVLFNGMINPLIPFNIKGSIWYQGESNVGRAEQYLKLFPGMIEDWRTRWKSEFSFYFVQIAPFDYGNQLSPKLRDAQRKSLKTTNTGMAIAMDIGHPISIHPGNKQDAGNRLARLSLANDYGQEIVASGPLYKSHTISKNKIIIEFDYIGSGLMAKDSNLSGFEMAGEDKNFVPANAEIVNNKIEVSASTIDKPVNVRYAWKDYIEPSLFNKEGLPASSFETNK